MQDAACVNIYKFKTYRLESNDTMKDAGLTEACVKMRQEGPRTTPAGIEERPMYSAQLAKRLVEISYQDLPSEVVEITKRCVEDFVGVALAGEQADSSMIWRQYYQTRPRSGRATLLQPGFPQTNYHDAAAYNAAAGHALDYDDVHNSSIVHLGAVTIPVALAMGQQLELPGTRLIEAIVAGYEAGARVGETLNPESYYYWHATGVAGVFAAAATAARLLNLNEQQMLHCLGSAGTQVSGLWEFLEDGAMSKTLHVVHACRAGIMAAEISRLGFTGASRIMEGDKGVARAIATPDKLRLLTEEGPYKITENSFKPYACCRHAHSPIYAALTLADRHQIKAEEVASVTVRSYSTAIGLIDTPSPTSPYAAKFSIQYCLAAALLYGKLTDKQFSESCIRDHQIQSLMKTVSICQDDEIEAQFLADPTKWMCAVTIATRGGREYTRSEEYPFGDPQNAFTWEDTDAKFLELASEMLGRDKAGQMAAVIRRLETLPSADALFA